MQVTPTCRIAGQQNHLLGGVAQEQVFWVTYHEIPVEQWNKVMAIKRAEERAQKRVKGLQLGPPNKFSSVPKEPSKNLVQLNMSQ